MGLICEASSASLQLASISPNSIAMTSQKYGSFEATRATILRNWSSERAERESCRRFMARELDVGKEECGESREAWGEWMHDERDDCGWYSA